jgi:hypothetical protein
LSKSQKKKMKKKASAERRKQEAENGGYDGDDVPSEGTTIIPFQSPWQSFA